MDEFATVKLYHEDGAILWKSFDGGADFRDDRAWAVAVGPDDHPVVTGVSINADETASFLTIKYDKDSGDEIWRRRVNGAVNDQSRSGWIGCDAAGNVVMANRTWRPGVSYDVVLQKYAAADGDSIWGQQYDGPSHTADDLRAMILDPLGNPLVAGISAGDYMALKFDGASGDLIWRGSYDGPPGGYDLANCVAVGPAGNVLVSGFSTGDAVDWDVATVAFDPDSGTVEWSLRFDGDDQMTDEGRVLAIGPDGDVFVAGYSYALVTGMDLLAIRYRSGAVAVAGPQPAPVPSVCQTIYPNPFGPTARVSISAPVALDAARLLVYDAQGRRVRTLPLGALPRGDTSIVWDGLGEGNRPLPNGVYFVRLAHRSGDGQVTKAILAR